LGAPPVRGHRGIIDDAGLRYRLATLPAGGDPRPPGNPSRRLPSLVWCAALALAADLNASGCGSGRTRRSAASRGVAEVPRRRPVFHSAGRADEPDQEEPTRLTAGQAATTAPTRPRDQPWAIFAVRVAAIPRPSSQRARDGTGTRCRAAYSTTIELA
jgi:hypothetical protein